MLTIADFPLWLTVISIVSLGVAVVTAAWIAVDETRRPPASGLMALVWPVTALFGGVLWLIIYLRNGRGPLPGSESDSRPERSDAANVLVATSHCGAGCSLGDLLIEWSVFFLPGLAVAGGLGMVFDDRIFAVWVLDFVAAFAIGILLQYLSVRPGSRSARAALTRAIKADAASISAWQVGMYGFMAIIQFAVFPALWSGRAGTDTPEFWFAMQWAMIAGFALSSPVNALLLRVGIKEAM